VRSPEIRPLIERDVMTTRRLALAGLCAVLIGACASSSTPAPGGGGGGGSSPGAAPSSAGGQGGGTASQAAAGGGDSLAVRAQKVTDACTLMPMDLAAKIVPGGGAPQSQKFPPFMCTVSNGTQVVQITVGGYDAVDPLSPADTISGLGTTAYYQAQLPDDAYLKVVLSPEQGALYVEVAGHDGKDHKADAIAVAQYALAHLP
jgi:hypothetical protein